MAVLLIIIIVITVVMQLPNFVIGKKNFFKIIFSAKKIKLSLSNSNKTNCYFKGVNGFDACPLQPLIPIWLILGFVLFFPISCIQMKYRVENAIK